MPDISSYVNSAGFQIAANFQQHKNFQSDVGREICVKLTYTGSGTGITNEDIKTFIEYVTTAHGANGVGDDPWVIGAMGTADGSAFAPGANTEIFMRMQGTGNTTPVNAVAGTDLSMEIVAYFAPLH
jgi:hypothetical protein